MKRMYHVEAVAFCEVVAESEEEARKLADENWAEDWTIGDGLVYAIFLGKEVPA